MTIRKWVVGVNILIIVGLGALGYFANSFYQSWGDLKSSSGKADAGLSCGNSDATASQMRDYFRGFTAEGKLDNNNIVSGGQNNFSFSMRQTDTNRVAVDVVNETDCTVRLSLGSYEMYDQTLVNQKYFASRDGVVSSPQSTTRLEVNTPSCMTQVDLYAGAAAPHYFTKDGVDNLPPGWEDTTAYLGAGYLRNQGTTWQNAKGAFCTKTPPPPPVNPPPPASDLVCAPANQNITKDSDASFVASGGSGTYSWSGNSAVPSTGNGKNYTAKFSSVGSYNVVVNDGSKNATCVVVVTTVTPPPVNPPPASQTLDVGITKQASPTSVLVGQQSVFTMVAKNNGNVTASNLIFTDILPAGVEYVSHNSSRGIYQVSSGTWDIGTLNVGQSETLSITVRVATVGTKVNTISLSSVYPADTNASNNQASAAVTAIQSSPAPLVCAPGSQSVTINQTASFVAAGSGPAYSWSSTGGSPTSGSGSSFASTFASPGSYTIRVTSAGQTASCQLSVIDLPPPPSNSVSDLSLTKTVSPTSLKVGDSAVFSIIVRNEGNVKAPLVSVKDVLPAGLSLTKSATSVGTFDSGTGVWSIGELLPGYTASLLLTVKAEKNGSFENIAEIFTDGFRDVDSTPNNGVVGEDDLGKAVLTVGGSPVLPPAGFPLLWQLLASTASLSGAGALLAARRRRKIRLSTQADSDRVV